MADSLDLLFLVVSLLPQEEKIIHCFSLKIYTYASSCTSGITAQFLFFVSEGFLSD